MASLLLRSVQVLLSSPVVVGNFVYFPLTEISGSNSTFLVMAASDETERLLLSPVRRFQPPMILKFVLGLFWYFLQLVVSIVHIWWKAVDVLVYCMISYGLLKKYKNLKLLKLRYLAIVIDSKEAKDKRKVKQLLYWLSDLGVKHAILYDIEGVLKKSMELDTLSLNGDPKASNGLIYERGMTLELLSFSDNKEAIAKAASFLCSKYMKAGYIDSTKTPPVFTEADISDSLKEIGLSGPDPDLLLVYGPARCHLGFPAWRIRYTEIVHMGPLKSISYGAIVKAIYDFSKKNQNYGS